VFGERKSCSPICRTESSEGNKDSTASSAGVGGSRTLAAARPFPCPLNLSLDLGGERCDAAVVGELVQLLGLVFGVEIGRSIAVNWFGPIAQAAPHSAFDAWYLLAALAAGFAFTLTLRARLRDAWVMCTATALALVASELGAVLLGHGAAAFAAALTLGVVGNLAGVRMRRSPLVFIVPGVLMLVPGSAGYNSVLKLVTDQTVNGITAGFDTFVTAISIAYGLLVSAVLLPRRLTPLGPAVSNPEER
jgi:uncharacterized membrane protein YjjB (DUF3815 family)